MGKFLIKAHPLFLLSSCRYSKLILLKDSKRLPINTGKLGVVGCSECALLTCIGMRRSNRTMYCMMPWKKNGCSITSHEVDGVRKANQSQGRESWIYTSLMLLKIVAVLFCTIPAKNTYLCRGLWRKRYWVWNFPVKRHNTISLQCSFTVLYILAKNLYFLFA